VAFRVLVISDAHFFNPQYFQHVIHGGARSEPPSRLSTDAALGDRKANPFHALIHLARQGAINASAVVCCGDLTTCADPTAMNLGWLQLHRLAAELGAGEPIVTVGNHDLDSRFKTSATSPQRILRFLDPPFPTADVRASASYWSSGYCVMDRVPDVRFVLVNSCSLHGYQTEKERQLDHGAIPEQIFSQLPDDLASRSPAQINILVCHHHPVEIELPPEDKSVVTNGDQLIKLLSDLSPPNWMILHGHRHLPKVHYANSSATSPVIFSAGSLAANLHLGIQGRAANQFYVLDIESDSGAGIRGRYEAWTWDQYEGDWRKGEDTLALPGQGGFGYRPDPTVAASRIAQLLPAQPGTALTWHAIEDQECDFKYLLPQHRSPVLAQLETLHGIVWESDSDRSDVAARLLRLGRRT
jgi:hypothetical protein